MKKLLVLLLLLVSVITFGQDDEQRLRKNSSNMNSRERKIVNNGLDQTYVNEDTALVHNTRLIVLEDSAAAYATDFTTGELNVTGDATVVGDINLTGGLDQRKYGLIIGSDAPGAPARSDSTNKFGSIAFPHFLIGEKNVHGLTYFGTGETSIINLGGGYGGYNATTATYFWAAGSIVNDNGTHMATIDTTGFHLKAGAFKAVQLTGSLTDGAPTDAQIDTITGSTPAGVGAGWSVTILDSDGSGLLYRIESDGTNWQYQVLAIAT